MRTNFVSPLTLQKLCLAIGPLLNKRHVHINLSVGCGDSVLGAFVQSEAGRRKFVTWVGRSSTPTVDNLLVHSEPTRWTRYSYSVGSRRLILHIATGLCAITVGSGPLRQVAVNMPLERTKRNCQCLVYFHICRWICRYSRARRYW